MAIDFPDSPSNGQAFTSNNKTWVFDGTSWNITSGTNSVADGAITTAKVADNAVTQTKLAASLSAVTVTTSANRNAAVPSPFTGQLVFLTDTKKMQVWDGSAWLNITLAPPEPPTSLSATALSNSSIAVAFTAGGANGSPITNYKYALSTNGGSSYGSFTALDPVDVSSPITISGLAQGTTYHVKLKAVNDMGDSVESSATSTTTLVVPNAPTNLSASNATLSTVDISFTAGSDNGYAITNYQYALSTNGGSSYGSFTALNPADASSPITITGLTHSTAYYIKLKAVNSGGAGAESSAIAATTGNSFTVDYLVVAGGGGGGGSCQSPGGGGGGAGGLRSSVTASGGNPGTAESAGTAVINNNYAVVVGSGGGGGTGDDGSASGRFAPSSGANSSLTLSGGTITSVGGGRGGVYDSQTSANAPGSGGSGGGCSYTGNGGAGTANQGFAGGNNSGVGTQHGAGGGGAAGLGANATNDFSGGAGGAGRAVAITGSSVSYAGGGGAGVGYSGGVQTSNYFLGGAGGGGNGGTNQSGNLNGSSGTTNTGGGGGGAGAIYNQNHTNGTGGSGGSGVIILRYTNAVTITLGAGLTGSTTTVSSNKITTITAGSGNVSWS